MRKVLKVGIRSRERKRETPGCMVKEELQREKLRGKAGGE